MCNDKVKDAIITAGDRPSYYYQHEVRKIQPVDKRNWKHKMSYNTVSAPFRSNSARQFHLVELPR